MIQRSKTDQILTWIFLALAVVAVICYFALPTDRTAFLFCGGAAISIRLLQYLIRFIS